MQIILKDKFYSDGRGPELQKIYWGGRGTYIEAIDFYNPDDTYDEKHLKHLVFKGLQAFMLTPEDEYANIENIDYAKIGKGAIFNFGKSPWYKSFSNIHSKDCNHYRITFYDHTIDAVAEDIEIKDGGFKG